MRSNLPAGKGKDFHFYPAAGLAVNLFSAFIAA
jgi:hypothetical protein